MAFDTPLTEDEERQFQVWKKQNAPSDSGEDYDFRGAFKAGLTPGPDQHWRDTFKKPNHPTFSDESIYSSLTGTKPGHWQGEKFMAFDQLSDILNDKVPQLSRQTPDVEAIRAQMFSTGEFAKANARQAIFKPQNAPPMQVTQIGFGGSSNTNAKAMFDELDQTPNTTFNAAKPPSTVPMTQRPRLDEMGGEARTPAQLDAIRTDQMRIEQKLGIGKKKKVENETEDQRLRREHPELF